MEKPFIQWNTQSTLSKKPYQHHVCMFHEQHLASQPEQIHKIQQDSALYLRFKQYSSLYHDYLIDYAMKIDEILPHGCLELFLNHFHIEKDKSFIPLLSSILTNLYPVSSFESVRFKLSPDVIFKFPFSLTTLILENVPDFAAVSVV